MISKSGLIWTIVFIGWDFLFVDVFGSTKNIAFLCYCLMLPILGWKLINPLRKVWNNPDRLEAWINNYTDGTQIPAFIVYCFLGTLISITFNWIPFYAILTMLSAAAYLIVVIFFIAIPRWHNLDIQRLKDRKADISIGIQSWLKEGF